MQRGGGGCSITSRILPGATLQEQRYRQWCVCSVHAGGGGHKKVALNVRPREGLHMCTLVQEGQRPDDRTIRGTSASGTLNPLCRVRCTFRSVHLLTIGPMFVCNLATDMFGHLTYSPKQLYSTVWHVCTPWLRTPTSPLDRRAVAQVSRTIPGHSDSGSAP